METQTIDFKLITKSFFLLRKQVILPVLFIIAGSSCFAQREIYHSDHDNEAYYFGITLGYASSSLHATKSTRFLQDDSVMSAQPGASGGVILGLLATGRLTDRFQIRVNPQLVIGGSRYLNYTLGSTALGESVIQQKILPTILLSLPLQFKFNSDRIDNFRTYLLAGIKYDIDIASNSTARNAEGMVKLKSGDFGLEGGIGFNFFLPFVTISPEIKFSYGLSNIHQRDPNLKYSSVFDVIQSRMIVFSLHFE